MARALDRLNWQWLETIDVSLAINARHAYQLYLILPTMIIDVLMLAPVLLTTLIFLLVEVSHFTNASFLHFGLYSLTTADRVQNFYDINVVLLPPLEGDLFGIIGGTVGALGGSVVGVLLVVCARRLIVSLRQDELWALILAAVLTALLFICAVTLVIYLTKIKRILLPSHDVAVVLIQSALPLFCVVLHCGGVWTLRRKPYFRAERMVGTPGFRSFMRRFGLSGDLNSVRLKSLRDLALRQLLRLLLTALGIIIVLGILKANSGPSAESELLKAAVLCLSLVSILVAIARSFSFSKFGKWNIPFVVVVIYVYSNQAQIDKVMTWNDYCVVSICLVVFLAKHWIFQPLRLIIQMWRVRSVSSAPHALNKQRGNTGLILRSFKERDAASGISPSHAALTFAFGGDRILKPMEEVIVDALSQSYTMITVADPRRDVGVVGAARALLPDDDWKDYIVERMREARVIIVILGATESLAWEVSQAIRLGIAERLVLVPPIGFFAEHTLADVSVELAAMLRVSGEGVEAALGTNVRAIAFDVKNSAWRAYSTSGTSERNYSFSIRAAVALTDLSQRLSDKAMLN